MKNHDGFFAFKFLFLFVFSIFTQETLAPNGWAEISHNDLKGVHRLFAPEYEFLSPIYGFTLLKTKMLDHRRLYGNYGPEKEGFGCFDPKSKLGQTLRSQKDCPQDKVSELIQRLFPIADGGLMALNRLDSDIASHLGAETLGKILGFLSTLPTHLNERGLTPSEQESREAELGKILFQSLNPIKYLEKQKNDTKAQLKKWSSDSFEFKENLTKKLQQIEDDLSQFEGDSSSDGFSSPQSHSSSLRNSPYPRGRVGFGKQKDYRELSTLILQAGQECHEKHYPLHLVEHIFLAAFIKDANTKEDFISLIRGMHQLNPRIISNEPKILDEDSPVQHQFLQSKYQASEFNPTSLLVRPQEAARELLNDPEKLAFFASQDKLTRQDFPPEISRGSANHSSLGGETYSDCGETSLRNFLNRMLFNPRTGQFDHKFLKNLKSKFPMVQLNPHLEIFYQHHSDPGQARLQQVRNDWSETVVSKLKGVQYLGSFR